MGNGAGPIPCPGAPDRVAPMPYQVAALGAAFFWALSGLVAATPSRELGGPRFTRLRMVVASVLLFIVASIFGDWSSLPLDGRSVAFLVGSAVVGLLIGDAALFTAFARFGPRRTSMVFTTNAPMAAIIGVVVLDEEWTALGVLGTVLIVIGVLCAVFFGNKPGQAHRFETIVGNPLTAFGWALLGALGQAIGAILIDPVFDAGASTWTVSASRVLIATPLLWIFARPLDKMAQSENRAPMTLRYWAILGLSAAMAMVIGMTLLLDSFKNGPIGPATILSATTPIMMLPLLWMATKERPGVGSWIGALVAFVGTALLVGSGG